VTEAPADQRIAALRARMAEVEKENEQLRRALASRIVIEQAKGVLVERLDLPPDEVFELIRSASRRAGMKLHDLAAEILKSRLTPELIEQQIAHLTANREPGGSRRIS
jgi:AmiR/NasT family two-component response regulator